MQVARTNQSLIKLVTKANGIRWSRIDETQLEGEFNEQNKKDVAAEIQKAKPRLEILNEALTLELSQRAHVLELLKAAIDVESEKVQSVHQMQADTLTKLDKVVRMEAKIENPNEPLALSPSDITLERILLNYP
jgi:hypothetical protein